MVGFSLLYEKDIKVSGHCLQGDTERRLAPNPGPGLSEKKR